MTARHYSALDQMLIGLQQAVATACGGHPVSERPYPGPPAGAALNEADRRLAEALMRVNHAGEVAAQALYQAQGLVARDRQVAAAMERAAREEIDHLVWCETRLRELDGRPSLLAPFWYAGSFAIGAAAALVGDRWNLGFVAETERQVTRHLESHLERLPQSDAASRAVVTRMRDDEAAHATRAVEAGAAELPGPVRRLMRVCAGVMTAVAFYI